MRRLVSVSGNWQRLGSPGPPNQSYREAVRECLRDAGNISHDDVFVARHRRLFDAHVPTGPQRTPDEPDEDVRPKFGHAVEDRRRPDAFDGYVEVRATAESQRNDR